MFQTSSLSTSSSSTSFTNPYIPSTFANNNTNNNNNNNNNHTSYPSYRSNSSLYSDSNHFGQSSYPMSSSTYRSSTTSGAFTLSKPASFHQTREKEKFELSTLNDKFADYVEKVRYLEAQNKKVQMESNLISDKQQANCQRIKTMFENEVAQLKETVEKLFKDKNTLTYSAKDAQVSSKRTSSFSIAKPSHFRIRFIL